MGYSEATGDRANIAKNTTSGKGRGGQYMKYQQSFDHGLDALNSTPYSRKMNKQMGHNDAVLRKSMNKLTQD